MLYLADVPTDTDRMPVLGGVPAPDVPQYWHRADGFDDTFIAHTESRQRVKFAREHVGAASAPLNINRIGNKNNVCVFIFSLSGVLYQKISRTAKRKTEKQIG